MTQLVVFDLDGTLARQRGGFDLLHALFGTTDNTATLQKQFDRGEITFEDWCQATIDMGRNTGITKTDINQASLAVKPKAGADRVLNSLRIADIEFGIISAGIANLAVGFEQYKPLFICGNWIRFDGEQLSGIDVNVGPNQKGELLREIRTVEEEIDIIYIGDSHTDTEAFVEADSALLFDPDERVPDEAKTAADHIVESTDLYSVFRDVSCVETLDI